MRAVNLLPREATKQQQKFAQERLPLVVGAGLGVVVAGLLAIGYTHEHGKVADAKARYTEVEAQLRNTPEPPKPQPDPNSQLVGEKNARVTAVSTAIGARLAMDRIFRELALVMPDDITLSNLNLTETVGAATPTAQLTISGITYSHDSVARLLSRLAFVPDLTDVSLVTSASNTLQTADSSGADSTDKAAAGGVNFTINAGVQMPPGAAALAPPPVPVAPPTTDSTDSGATS
jgi:Tfp pilus assembly protein PilN